MSTLGPSETLAAVTAQAQKAYSLKDYSASVTLFARACEVQAAVHGSEDDPRNAHLLYLYGKALYQVAISKSDILGGAADVSRGESKGGQGQDKLSVADTVLTRDLDAAKRGKVISFQGDENWDTDEEAEEEGGAEAGEREAEAEAEGEEEDDSNNNDDDDDDDDMAVAWQVLDLARILFHKTLDPHWTPSTPITSLTTSKETSKENPKENPKEQPPPLTPTQHVSLLTQLSDTYDLLGEISLESENFTQSISDLRSSLALKLHLFSPHDKLVSEAHYKLSLALEFASAMEGIPDQDSCRGREEAAEQMDLAVRSVKARIAVEQDALAASGMARGKGKGKANDRGVDADSDGDAHKSLAEAREIVAELEQRLVDLRAPHQNQGSLDLDLHQDNPVIAGLLKSVLAQGQGRLQEAISNATDVSGLVRKKDKPQDSTETDSAQPPPHPQTKRKLQDVEMEHRVVVVSDKREKGADGAKKAKVEESLSEAASTAAKGEVSGEL